VGGKKKNRKEGRLKNHSYRKFRGRVTKTHYAGKRNVQRTLQEAAVLSPNGELCCLDRQENVSHEITTRLDYLTNILRNKGN
jgi:hypothetical protein